jgi:hypothetical protein
MRALNRLALPSAVVAVAVGVTGVGLASSLSSCAQRPVPCTVGRSLPYAAKYQPVATEGTCDGVPAASLAGDQLGLSTYSPTKEGGLPDTSRVDVAIRTLFLGGPVAAAFDRGVVDEDDNHAAAARGSFAADVPDEDGLCTAPTLTPTAQVLPALPEDTEAELPAQDAVNVTETWSDVAVYVDAAALGTQMKGTYTVTQDGCTATYRVLAMYPATDCTGADGGPDQAVCDDPAAGISPDFPVVCDPALLLCVLDAAVDARLPISKD